jgi:phenylalanyl-tRNA synthetase beta subunit
LYFFKKRIFGSRLFDRTNNLGLCSLGLIVEICFRRTKVTTPYWRSDVNIEADLIEEVARIQGQQNSAALLAEPLPFNPDPIFNLKHEFRMD